jgi:hypothetical protein
MPLPVASGYRHEDNSRAPVNPRLHTNTLYPLASSTDTRAFAFGVEAIVVAICPQEVELNAAFHVHIEIPLEGGLVRLRIDPLIREKNTGIESVRWQSRLCG